MKVVEIKDIYREEIPLYYRRKYTGNIVIELPMQVNESPIEFTIETGPAGNKELDIDMSKKIDYPLIPLMNAIKKFVLELDDDGLLP